MVHNSTIYAFLGYFLIFFCTFLTFSSRNGWSLGRASSCSGDNFIFPKVCKVVPIYAFWVEKVSVFCTFLTCFSTIYAFFYLLLILFCTFSYYICVFRSFFARFPHIFLLYMHFLDIFDRFLHFLSRYFPHICNLMIIFIHFYP